MDWVERRFVFEKDLQAAWIALRTDLENAARTFDRRYANPQIAEIHAQVKDWCISITYNSCDRQRPARSIQICLDEKGKRVFSRVNDVEEIAIYLGFDSAGKAHLVDASSQVLANDKACQMLLEPFLFPDSIPADHVRFAIATAP